MVTSAWIHESIYKHLQYIHFTYQCTSGQLTLYYNILLKHLYRHFLAKPNKFHCQQKVLYTQCQNNILEVNRGFKTYEFITII